MTYNVDPTNKNVTIFPTRAEANDAYDKVVDAVRAEGYFLVVVTHLRDGTGEEYGYSLARYKGGWTRGGTSTDDEPGPTA